MRPIVFALFACMAAAQNPPAADVARASVSGVVRDQGTGAPIAQVQVAANRLAGVRGQRPVNATTDAEGRYTLHGLEPGAYRLTATLLSNESNRFMTSASRPVTLTGDQELAGIDLRLQPPCEISGKVVDENNEPVAGINVLLVSREYYLGQLRHKFVGAATTDDQGKYTLGRITAGRAYLLHAQTRPSRIPAVSDAPDDPKWRKPVPLPTYFPDSPNAEGAEALVLRVAEHRDNVNIRVRKSASFCVEGTARAPAGPSDLYFQIGPGQPSAGVSESGGFYMSMPGGKVGADGRLRICDLHPGEYQLEVSRSTGFHTDFLGATPIVIADKDVTGVTVTALPRIPVRGEIAWDGDPPKTPVTANLMLNLRSLTRTIYESATTAIPGAIAFDGLILDEYSVDFNGLPGTLYVKDFTYGNQSILHRSFPVGNAMGDAGLRILIGQDGGFVTTKVADKDGNPVGDGTVMLFPQSAASQAGLAAELVTGQTDQNGIWKSPALRPGKYYVVAGLSPVDHTPETIDKLWRSRNRAQEIELSPGAGTAVTLEPKGIE